MLFSGGYIRRRSVSCSPDLGKLDLGESDRSAAEPEEIETPLARSAADSIDSAPPSRSLATPSFSSTSSISVSFAPFSHSHSSSMAATPTPFSLPNNAYLFTPEIQLDSSSAAESPSRSASSSPAPFGVASSSLFRGRSPSPVVPETNQFKRISIESPMITGSAFANPLPSPVTKLATQMEAVELFAQFPSQAELPPQDRSTALAAIQEAQRGHARTNSNAQSRSKRTLGDMHSDSPSTAGSSPASSDSSPPSRSTAFGDFPAAVTSSRQLKFSPGKQASPPRPNVRPGSLPTQSSFRSIASDNWVRESLHSDHARAFAPPALSSVPAAAAAPSQRAPTLALRHRQPPAVSFSSLVRSSAFEPSAASGRRSQPSSSLSPSPTPQTMENFPTIEISKSSQIESELDGDGDAELDIDSEDDPTEELTFESPLMSPHQDLKGMNTDTREADISSVLPSPELRDLGFFPPPPIRRSRSEMTECTMMGRPVPPLRGLTQLAAFQTGDQPFALPSPTVNLGSKSARVKYSTRNREQQHPYPPDFRSSTPKPRLAAQRLVSVPTSQPSTDSDTAYHKPKLPLVPSEHVIPGCNTISCETMADLIRNPDKVRELYDRIFIIDCRYPYEYEGGHIRGAENYFQFSQLYQRFLQDPELITNGNCHRTCLIFHCEFSQKRGPEAYRALRAADRNIHGVAGFPNLFYAEIYAIQGGYKEFYRLFPDLCDPRQYVPMIDIRFLEEEKKYSALLKAAKNETALLKTSKSMDRSHSLNDLRSHRIQRSASTASSPKVVHQSLTRCVSPANWFNSGFRSHSVGPGASSIGGVSGNIASASNQSSLNSASVSTSASPRESLSSHRIDEDVHGEADAFDRES